MSEPKQRPELTVLEESGSSAAKHFDGPPIHRVNSNFLLYGRWSLNTFLLALGDALALSLSLLLAAGLRAYFKGTPMFPEWSWFLIGAWWVAALGVHLLPGWGLGPVEELRRTILLLVGVFAATTTSLFLAKMSDATSRLTLTVSFIICVPLLPLVRLMIKRALIRFKLWGMEAIVYGDIESASLVIDALNDEPGMGYVPVAIYDEAGKAQKTNTHGLPVISGDEIKSVYASAAILAMQGISRHRLLEILEGPLSVFRHVVVIPDLLEAPSLWVKPRDMGGILGLEISSNLLDFWAGLSKRAVDLVFVFLMAPLWVPLCLVISFMIWAYDRRSPLFIHRRAGLRGEPFNIWKFRTMRHDAESCLERHLQEDEDMRVEWETNFKLRKDPRITPVGRFLRRTSMDELPQLVNVFKGEMSLVGPRPLPEYHDQGLPERIRRMRARVKPGMTGLWQVSGRSEVGNKGIEKWDTYYVRNWSIWLDIVILFRTVSAVLRREGAY